MARKQIMPGVHVTALDADKFKRYKINLHFILPGQRESATALALLPHLLERRCAQIPDPMLLSRRLFDLYGAELTGESYTAGQNRVLTLGITGLKGEYALNGEDLAAEGLELLLQLVFNPVVENGGFAAEDVAIEAAKQTDFLRSEMNDKRGYCLRQARRKLYGDAPLGIESAGYLDDIEALTPQSLYAAYQDLLCRASVEVVVCGADGDKAARQVQQRMEKVQRQPVQPLAAAAAEGKPELEKYAEAMDTVQGKLCILLTSGRVADANEEAVMRLASAMLGGLPTSRLFQNVREKQSLCYYCTSVYGAFSGTLQMDSGVNHEDADKAAAAMLHELAVMQREPVTGEELANAKLALKNSFSSAKDSPDALANWAFSEWLRGTNQTLDEAAARIEAITAQQVQAALAAFAPAVQYQITGKEGA